MNFIADGKLIIFQVSDVESVFFACYFILFFCSYYEQDEFEGFTDKEYEVMLMEYFGREKYEQYNMKDSIGCM
ncbi:MAG: hypothetical protein MJE68_09870 [Proteobacteria bacterium]|nr:hypothetical protein [Pseudomonadota bacterium]